jgi:3-methyl-2-oxobutanoate hydroxymethyltransferase
MKIQDFLGRKKSAKKISMVTCYDYTSACLLAQTPVDCILVGDSSAMTVYGFKTTLQATVSMMALQTSAVARALEDLKSHQFLIADMPFLAHRMGLVQTIKNVQRLMQAGAHAVKIEGAGSNLSVIKHVVQSGVPVMGHLGLTPQSFHQLGGNKVQAKLKAEQEQLLKDALALQEAGCFSLVLECVPRTIAKEISLQLEVPTIGIGAGADTDGQVLVWQDLLGLNENFKPKFLRKFHNLSVEVKNALTSYHLSVVDKKFPSEQESFE